MVLCKTDFPPQFLRWNTPDPNSPWKEIYATSQSSSPPWIIPDPNISLKDLYRSIMLLLIDYEKGEGTVQAPGL